MTKWDKKYFTDEQKAKIREDKKRMSYAELKQKWGGSIGGLQKICQGGEIMGAISNIRKDSARRRDYKEQLDKAHMEIARLNQENEKLKQAVQSSDELVRAFAKRLWA